MWMKNHTAEMTVRLYTLVFRRHAYAPRVGPVIKRVKQVLSFKELLWRGSWQTPTMHAA